MIENVRSRQSETFKRLEPEKKMTQTFNQGKPLVIKLKSYSSYSLVNIIKYRSMENNAAFCNLVDVIIIFTTSGKTGVRLYCAVTRK